MIIFLSVLISGGCGTEDGIEIPVNRDSLTSINSFDIYHIHQTNVKSRTTIISFGNQEIQERGVCWSETINPTTDDNIKVSGSREESFVTMITGLSANTTYFARAYINLSWGTIYGEEKSFTTACKPLGEECEGTFTDTRDGMEYGWVRIGNQVWMAENLAWLPSVRPPYESSLIYPYYYVYDYFGYDINEARITDNYNLYGVIYNWEAVTQGAVGSNSDPSGIRGCCPAGWHVPSLDEWLKLEDYVSDDGHFGDEGTILKSNYGWVDASGNGTDDYGFSAMPNGGRNEFNGGSFGSVGENAHWWTATDDGTPNGWMTDITLSRFIKKSNISSFDTNKNFAFGVRCVRD